MMNVDMVLLVSMRLLNMLLLKLMRVVVFLFP